MFAHKLSMHLKNDGAFAFKHKIENEVIPLLRKQEGFLHEITFLYLSGREVERWSLGNGRACRSVQSSDLPRSAENAGIGH